MEATTDSTEAYPITTEASTSESDVAGPSGTSEESPTKRQRNGKGKAVATDEFGSGNLQHTEDWLNRLADTALNANNKREKTTLTPSASVASFISSFSGYGDEEDELEEVGWAPDWRPGLTPPPRVEGVATPPPFDDYRDITTPPFTPPIEAV